MNYERIYNQIIQSAKKSNRKKLRKSNPDYIYYEKHHIIPRCLGGTDDIENLVLLTAKEHFICHRLLCEMYPDNSKLIHAFWRMCTVKNSIGRSYKISAKTFNDIRLKKSKIQSGMVSGSNNPMFGKSHNEITKSLLSKPKSTVHKQLQSQIMRAKYIDGEMTPHNKGKTGERYHSDESKKKMSNSRKGKPKTSEWKLMQSLRMKQLQKQKILCESCSLEFDKRNYSRWHGEKCKHKKPVIIVNEKS